VDLETPPGSYELTLIKDGVFIRKTIEVKEWDYGIERIRLPKEMVELDKKTLKRVWKEAALIKGLWAGSERSPLFTGPFIMPVDGRVSGKFGTRRILNGSPRSPHSGLDFAAPEGTPVVAANSGSVVFIGDFFFKGRFVVIDHGLGVFTAYSHLSEVLTEEGRMVRKGEVIGEVGSSGRATGAHLHFSVMVGGMRVSPEILFESTERLFKNLPQEASKGATSG
jgi:murein DD-endopeptidase MepM/ murein hydrolase activator NlpD